LIKETSFLYADVAASRLGINTGAPTSTLDIYSSDGIYLYNAGGSDSTITPTTIVQETSLQGIYRDSITSLIKQDILNSAYDEGWYHGETIFGELFQSTSRGQILYLGYNAGTNQQWDWADATAVNEKSTYLLGVACKNGGANDSIPILLRGFIASSVFYTTNNRYGPPVYLSTTPGDATTTPPATAGNVVRIIGHVDAFNNINAVAVLRFNPDNFWVVI
jgi:hypothetical protein